MNKIKLPKKAKIIVFRDPYMMELLKTALISQPKANGKIDKTTQSGVFRVSRTLHSGKRMVEYVKI